MSHRRRFAFTALPFAATLAVASAVPLPLAHAEPDAKPRMRQLGVRRVEIIRRGGDGESHLGFSFFGDALEGEPMKNAPFSAVAVTESVQELADGNRIVNKSEAALARDSQGRTRRELAIGGFGPLRAPGGGRPMVHIHDPTTSTSVTLDLEGKRAFRRDPRSKWELPLPHDPAELSLPGDGAGGPAAPGPEAHGRGGAASGDRPTAGPIRRIEEDVIFAGPGVPGPAGPGLVRRLLIDGLADPDAKPAIEDLGTRTIEGVRVSGTRSTHTIAAGAIGNQRPIVVTNERWFAPDLGVVVESRHSDPRLGTTTYRLTRIERAEPATSLFEIPRDFTVEEGPAKLLQRRVLAK